MVFAYCSYSLCLADHKTVWSRMVSFGTFPEMSNTGTAASTHSYEDLDKLVNTAEYLSWRRLHLAKSKLSNVAEMASFMAGFAVVATVELQINDQDVNSGLLTAFVVTTALLVGTSLLAIMISTCILPHIQAVAKMSVVSQVAQSPHEQMTHLINLAWVLANTASLFFFTLDVILMCWIKFTYFSRTASIAATVIMGPVLIIILIFGVVFYRTITKHQYIMSTMKFQELQRMKEQLDREDSVILTMSKSSSSTLNANFVGHNHPLNRVKTLQRSEIDPRGSLRSRGSTDSEGSFSKASRSRGSIFIV